jgi:hypothetical protein
MLHVFSRNSVKLVTRKPTTTLFRGGGSRSLRVRLAGILLWLWELFFDESLPKGAPKTAISRDLAKFPLFEHLARPGVKKCSPLLHLCTWGVITKLPLPFAEITMRIPLPPPHWAIDSPLLPDVPAGQHRRGADRRLQGRADVVILIVGWEVGRWCRVETVVVDAEWLMSASASISRLKVREESTRQNSSLSRAMVTCMIPLPVTAVEELEDEEMQYGSPHHHPLHRLQPRSRSVHGRIWGIWWEEVGWRGDKVGRRRSLAGECAGRCRAVVGEAANR